MPLDPLDRNPREIPNNSNLLASCAVTSTLVFFLNIRFIHASW